MGKEFLQIAQSIKCLKTAVKAEQLRVALNEMKSSTDNLKYAFFGRFCLALLLLSFSAEQSLAQIALKSQEVWPSIDAYYRINQKFRMYGTIGGTKLDESSYTDGAIGVFVDYFTYPVTSIFRPNHPDSLPGKFLWIRAGFQYSATPPSAEDPFKESMIVTEANARYYLPYKILFTWKNRFDWRLKNGEFNSRYRPKLMFEKDLHTEFLTFTATGFAEYYLNFGNSAVNRLRAQLGVEIKVLKHVNYEVFWNHQFSNQPEIQEVDAFGMTLKVYMDHNEFKDFIEKKKNKKKEKKEKKKNEAH